jgi:hypothetical protein
MASSNALSTSSPPSIVMVVKYGTKAANLAATLSIFSLLSFSIPSIRLVSIKTVVKAHNDGKIASIVPLTASYQEKLQDIFNVSRLL